MLLDFLLPYYFLGGLMFVVNFKFLFDIFVLVMIAKAIHYVWTDWQRQRRPLTIADKYRKPK